MGHICLENLFPVTSPSHFPILGDNEEFGNPCPCPLCLFGCSRQPAQSAAEVLYRQS